MLLIAAAALSVNPGCPHNIDGCTGTAHERANEARRRAGLVDLNRPWPAVREDIVQACGLRVQRSTSHCFEDFNHVDCCTMDTGHAHSTNEASQVAGMHRVNYLGAHITEASLADRGSGGSWCTCQISSPDDVCHKQFGARTAFKLVWCEGTGVAALLDDWANVLTSGKPTSAAGAEVPQYGGPQARDMSWNVLNGSRNSSWAERWRQSCNAVATGETVRSAAIGRGEWHDAHEHDEL